MQIKICRDGMNLKALKDIARITMGQSPESESYNELGKGLPFFQGNADFGELYPNERVWCSSPKKTANPGDILISVRAPIGALNYAKAKCCIGRGLAAITIENEAERNYVFHLLKAKNRDLINQGTGSTFKAIGKTVLEEIMVPQISSEEQKKCMKIMDLLEEIIRNRKSQLVNLDSLIKARFVEMFGDFRTNPMNWPVAEFTDIADIDGNMITDYEKYADYPHIGIDSIEKETGVLKGYRTVREDGVISGKYLFTEDHLIYSKIRPNLNKVAIPNFKGVCSADAYPILPKPEKCNRIFLAYDMRSSFFLDYILQYCNRTNLPKVNRKEVSGFKTPLPPLELQNLFAEFVTQIDKSKVAVQKALDEAQLLFDSLMQEYFG